MTNYDDVIVEMKELRTVKQRIIKLGKLFNEAEEVHLKSLLQHACAVMQAYDKSTKPIRGKTTPMAIYDFKEAPIAQLRQYCEAQMVAKKLAWQVEAEHQGWVADWKQEATRQGWTPPAT